MSFRNYYIDVLQGPYLIHKWNESFDPEWWTSKRCCKCWKPFGATSGTQGIKWSVSLKFCCSHYLHFLSSLFYWTLKVSSQRIVSCFSTSLFSQVFGFQGYMGKLCVHIYEFCFLSELGLHRCIRGWFQEVCWWWWRTP